MQRRQGYAAAALALALGSRIATAQGAANDEHDAGEPVVQELFMGESPYPQEPGALQLRAAPGYLRAEDGRETELGMDAEYGLSARLQLGAELPWVRSAPQGAPRAAGLGDVSVSVLYTVLRTARRIVSLYAEVQFPSGDPARGLGEGTTTYHPALLASQRIGPGVELYLNLGGEFTEGDRAVSYTGAGVARLHRAVAAVLELTGRSGHRHGGHLIPGLYWIPSNDFQIALGTPIGYGDAAGERQLLLQVVVEPW